HVGLEATKSRVQAIERHLHSVEGEAVGKHLQMNRRIFMSCEPEKPHLALLLGCEQSLRCALWSKNKVRIVFVDHLVYLPHVDMIGLQANQRLFKLAHGNILITA